ncbi:MAG: sulfotransferase family protein [Rhodanobacter sp.]|nr:MAG: sulfotransferase family protein [Rhodanobacter sp.]
MSFQDELQNQVVEFFNRRDWPRAAALAERLLQQQPGHAGAHYIAGVAQLELKRMPKALAHLHLAAQYAPGRADFHATYAKALAMGRLSGHALAAADRALALAPSDAQTLDMLGVAFTLNNAHARAAEVFRRAVEADPGDAHGHYNLATSLMFTGDLDAAERELEACVSIQPTFWKAHATISQLRRQTRQKNHLERLQALLDAHPDVGAARELLSMALAKEYEDLNEHARAFEYLARGKMLIKARQNYSLAKDEALFASLMEVAPAAASESPGCPSEAPIFVIGMPRSGTTLVERILSSHPEVHSAGELQQFGMALKRISGSQTPVTLDTETINRLGRADWRALGETYLASTRPMAGSTARFIDKLPHNFLYAGFIANALPKAKIICVRRHPMDTCLSNFRQIFAENSPFHGYANDLLDAGHYYILFDRLMAHWQQAFPGRILEVGYEALVNDQAVGTRRMLEYCQLPWDDACLDFEHNLSPVATASAVQVRSPIYRSALNRWKGYETQLQDLAGLLRSAGIEIEPS